MYSSMLFSVVIAMFYRAAVRQDAYNMLWAILCGFATLNILGLAARRMEPVSATRSSNCAMPGPSALPEGSKSIRMERCGMDQTKGAPHYGT